MQSKRRNSDGKDFGTTMKLSLNDLVSLLTLWLVVEPRVAMTIAKWLYKKKNN